MKKNYIFTSLLILSMIFTTYSQELLLNNGFENWTDSTTPENWTKVENTSQESTETRSGSFSAKMTADGTKDLGQTIEGIIPGDSYTITLWYKVDTSTGDGTDARIWSYWRDSSDSNITDSNTDGDLRGPSNSYLDNNNGVWTEYTTTVTAPAGATKFYFELRVYGSAVVYWDDLSFFKNAGSPEPSLTIISPSNNDVLNPETTSVDVSLSVTNFTVASGGTGDGYIQYSITGGTVVDKFDLNDITFTNLSAGSSYTVNVELVDNSGNSLSPAVSESVDFSVATYTTVADLAELRTGTEGNFYIVSGEVVLTYARSSRNQKYVQDTSAGILIDDSDNTIQTTYNTFDGITGLRGRLSSFNGLKQFVPTVDPGNASSTSNTIIPETVTIANFNANFESYESELIKLEVVTFADGNGSATFSSGENYDISQSSETTNFRTNFFEADYIGEVIPSNPVDLTVLGGQFNGSPQVTAIDLSGIVLGTKNNQIEGFATYPNPVTNNEFTVRSASSETKTVAIYNLIGKQVFSRRFTGIQEKINTTSMAKGLYILKVTEGTKVSTTKLVIR